ncbi:MAG: hypothetical protein CSA22_04880 [Deltaproteobacteria bacterium]|nr:MAG: hypothetical protein CSA22_04880 [Deltaproteobacteria bacterium]
MNQTESRNTPNRVITLITDFGMEDPYVGMMKGVVLSAAPGTVIVDITHTISPYAYQEALMAAVSTIPCFAAGTVHVVVVDPGVGGDRRIVGIEWPDTTVVLAPDNGIPEGVIAQLPGVCRVIEIVNPAYFRHPVHATFHGRDIFAPVAAALATGVPLSDMGPAFSPGDLTASLIPSVRELASGGFEGGVQGIDRFGNLITTIPETLLLNIQTAGDGCCIRIGDVCIDALSDTFSSKPVGDLVAYPGSRGWLEIAVNQGRADERLGAGIGTRVVVQRLGRV